MYFHGVCVREREREGEEERETEVAFEHMCVPLCSVAQSCLTLCHPMDCSPWGSSVHGIIQARILEQVAMSSSRMSSWPRNWTRVSCVSCIDRQILYHCTTWEAQFIMTPLNFQSTYLSISNWQTCPGAQKKQVIVINFCCGRWKDHHNMKCNHATKHLGRLHLFENY